MSWVCVTVDVPLGGAEVVEALLTEAGAAGLEVRDGSFRPMPGVRQPGPGMAIVLGSFEHRDDAVAAADSVRDAVEGASATIEEVPETDWSTAWRERIHSVTVGRLWVGPPWEREGAPRDKVCLVIEPKMAFGTGDHPTTALCLAAVDAYLSVHPGCSVLDVGTGTGVLAFAAKKLGSTRTVGIDNDPVAIELARECAQENGLGGLELSTKALDEVDGRFDLVLANILANTLIELAPLLAAKVRHRLVLAGVLVPQADEVREAYLAEGLSSAGDVVDGEWIRLDFERPTLAP